MNEDNKIGVLTRIRPMFVKEILLKELSERSYIIVSNKVLQIQGKNTLSELYKCNRVFGEDST
jgi:hypothetical protein